MWFTGKGDSGTTKTFGEDQKRISKASELPEALGTLDELNSFLGLCKIKASPAMAATLREVQETLFIIQAEMAGAKKEIGKEKIEKLETIVNEIEDEIPPLKGFSIAGGTEPSALLDVARTLARRAERRAIGVHDAGLAPLGENTRAYMNRLSSLLFALARKVNHDAGIAEENPTYR